MSEFACEVVRVTIEPHPDADAIEIARVGDYQSIVKKGQFQTGNLAVYIPEQAVLPQWLLKEMGFWDEAKGKGMLSGGAGNRVKAIKLRGVVSQGLVLSGNCCGDEESSSLVTLWKNCDDISYLTGFREGDDAAEFLGIVKYEPPLPSHMRGKAIGVDLEATHGYDFENIKKRPDLFDDGENVMITEKIHGTLLQVCVVPTKNSKEKYHQGRVVITSKGLGARGIVLDHNDDSNLYAQVAKKWNLLDGALRVLGQWADFHERPIIVFGEVFGKTLGGAGVQDLTYTGEKLDFRVFDICIGNRGNETYLQMGEVLRIVKEMNVKSVPVLYIGPYSKQIVLEHTDGPTTLGEGHIREGCVVKSSPEARHVRYGRKIAKSISDAYLLRKGNVTEFN